MLLLLSTVPFEYPYYKVVQREVSFLPMPHYADSSTYHRNVDLDLAEDSLYLIVTGQIEESWKGWDNIHDVKENLHCDSVKRRRDTVVVFSSLRFEFDKLTDELVACDLVTGMRYDGGAEKDCVCTIVEVLSRFDLGDQKYRLLSQAGCLATLGFKHRDGMMLINLSTGSLVAMEMRQPVKSKSLKRGCLGS